MFSRGEDWKDYLSQGFTNSVMKRRRLFKHKETKLEAVEEIDEEGDMPAIEGWYYWKRFPNFFLSSRRRLFSGLLVFRILNVWAMQTAFVPDEYWQSIEVAHQMVFGFGYKTWEWNVGLRSYTYPIIFAFFYKVLQLFHLDYRILLIKIPLLLQAILGTTADLFSYRLTYKLTGGNANAARWALFVQITSWYVFYTCTRTLTNSVEMSLTTIALFYYPWPHRSMSKHSNQTWPRYILLMACSIVLRPTSAILWLPMVFWNLSISKQKGQYHFYLTIKKYVTRGLLILVPSLIIDRTFYKYWTFPLVNFFTYNIINNVGTHYGTHPIYWYIISGIPTILGPFIILFYIAVYHQVEKICLLLVAWVVLFYSVLSHKEFRFLSGVMPLMLHVCACTLHQLFSSETNYTEVKDKKITKSYMLILKWFYVFLSIFVNITMSFYLSLVHQRGALDVPTYLDRNINSSHDFILHLMPCHSMPYYSHLHTPVQMRFLTCEPNLAKKQNYSDEADIFYSAPIQWLNSNFFEKSIIPNGIAKNNTEDLFFNQTNNGKSGVKSKRVAPDLSDRNFIKKPTYIILFDVLYKEIYQLLASNGYKLSAKYFHTQFPEGRVGEYIYILNLL